MQPASPEQKDAGPRFARPQLQALASRKIMEKYRKLQSEKKETIRTILRHGADNFDLKRYLKRARIKSEKHAKSLMPEHVIILEVAVKSMLLCCKYVADGPGNIQRNAFAAQIHQATNLIIASHEMILSGLEETARVTTRSYYESLDILLAIIVDETFAKKYFDENSESNNFWQSEIAYGKIYKYVQKALELAGFEEEVDEFVSTRKNVKSILSDAVHCGDSGAFRSWAVPPLGAPGRVSLEPHGVVSFHSANHATAIASETLSFLVIFVKLIASGKLDHVHKFPRNTNNSRNFFAHFAALQELYYKYELTEGSEIIREGYESDE